MTTLKFKSTIKCSGCIATVTPELDKFENIESWHVDLQSPDRILTVEGEEINSTEIMRSLEAVGYPCNHSLDQRLLRVTGDQ